MLDDALKLAAKQIRQERAEAEHQRAIEHENAANSIDDMADDDLREAISGHNNLTGLAESEGWANIRKNAVFRAEAPRLVARWLREKNGEEATANPLVCRA